MQHYRLKRNVGNIFKEGEIIRLVREDGGLAEIVHDETERSAWVNPDQLEPVRPADPPIEVDIPLRWSDFQAYTVGALQIKVERQGSELRRPFKALAQRRREEMTHEEHQLTDRLSYSIGAASQPAEAVGQVLYYLNTMNVTRYTLARVAWYMLMTDVERDAAIPFVGSQHLLATVYESLYDIAHDWQNQSPESEGE